MSTRQEVFDAINRERDYQDRKWGTIEENPHEVTGWLLVMQGGMDEAIRGWQKGYGDFDALRKVLQVVAVGCACLEQHGIVER